MPKFKTLADVAVTLSSPSATQLCLEHLRDDPHSMLGMWPASLSYHHAYIGGLRAHTIEVCNIAEALMTSNSIKHLKRDVVLTACLWHDFAKIREYVLTHKDFVADGARSLVQYGDVVWIKHPDVADGEHPHIKESADHFLRARKSFNFSEDFLRHVESCILSHHGKVEWGSPFEPQSHEAHIVHYADMLSARHGATL